MGIAKIALDPAPSVKQANVEKSAPNHPGNPLHPQANVGKKGPKPSWQAFTPPPPLRGNAFQKGASLDRQIV